MSAAKRQSSLAVPVEDQLVDALRKRALLWEAGECGDQNAGRAQVQ